MIRRAAHADAQAIHRVHMASIRELGMSHYSPEQVDAWCGNRSPDAYLSQIEGKHVWVALIDDEVCGFAQLDAGTATVEAVYVAPEVAHRGWGSMLLAVLEAQASGMGIGELRLDASLNAVAFYAFAGYSLVGQAMHELAPGVHIPCVTMRKALAPGGA
jgi:GNAT superfamily N-acetyltransferase